VEGDIITSYRRLSRGLVAGLRYLGAQVDLAEGEQDKVLGSAACFDVPSDYEVTAVGRKLIGSAQARRRGVVLQHGALPLRGDVGRLAAVLALSAEARQVLGDQLRRRAIALDQVVGRLVSWQEAMEALAVGFAQALKLELVRDDLTPHELATATRLQVRYSSNEWLFSR
jgi:lipoate-protein ligase A